MRDADVVRLPDEADEHPATHEDVLARMSDRESVQRGLEGLSPEVRRTFLMVFMEDLTCRETAAELKIPLGTVLSRLDSARRTLRQVMTRDDGAENGERPRDSAFRRPPRNSGDLGREEVRSP
jgi:DNA-directed RNA polymerase specialized sigma24 family protein